jgi:hypothetical protein
MKSKPAAASPILPRDLEAKPFRFAGLRSSVGA